MASQTPWKPTQPGDRLHVYTDAAGTPLFEVCRRMTKDGKRVWARRPDPTAPGGYRNDLEGVDARPLYRLPAVLAAVERGEQVHLVAGEKIADELETLGLVATTNPFGEGGELRPEHLDALRGARVVVWIDSDTPGRARGTRAIGQLQEVASELRGPIDLAPERTDGFDLADDIAEMRGRGASNEDLFYRVDGHVERAPLIVYEAPATTRPSYLTGAAFLAAQFPDAETFLGDPESVVYLSRGSFAMLYGPGGSAKTTLTLDLVAHLCSGRDWLGISVPRPLRVLVIENEGNARLFQRLLEIKAARFEADPAWAHEMLTVYAQPWGEFSFADAEKRADLLAVCAERNVDLICANPLFGVGGPGAGRPDETQAFVDLLKELGLWNGGPAIWLIHHAGKSSDVSGDWTRLPDTFIRLERVGDREMSVLTWEKTRLVFGDLADFQRKLTLAWDVPRKTFTRVDDSRGVSDAEITKGIDAYLDKHPASTIRTIREAVKGKSSRIAELLAEGAEEGRYLCVPGPNRSQLYSLADGALRLVA